MPEKPEVDLLLALKKPPKEAVDYFRSKGLQVTDNWWEVWREANARAFAVARSGKLSVLKTIRGELEKALVKGTTEREFVKTLKPRLQKLGWWGRRADGRMLGSPRRLKTIYRTNMMSSYNAGRWRGQKRLATADLGARPYFQYIAVRDARTRHSHAVLHGKVFHHDDPFWDHFYPPNGFNCRCRVRALTEDQVRRKKLKVETAEGKLDTVERRVASRKTGEGFFTQTTTYRGRDRAGRGFTFQTDPSFDYNPGQSWALYDKGAFLPGKPAPQKGYAAYGLKKAWEDLRRNAEAAPDVLMAALTEAAAGKMVALAMGLKKGVRRLLIETPVETVSFSWKNIPHIVLRITEKGQLIRTGRERFANFFLPTLKRPDEVWLTWDSRVGEYRKRYIKVFQGEDKARPIFAVVEEKRDGSLSTFVTVFRADWDYVDKNRAGALLYQRRKAG